jgi:hypothetical protein
VAICPPSKHAVQIEESGLLIRGAFGRPGKIQPQTIEHTRRPNAF